MRPQVLPSENQHPFGASEFEGLFVLPRFNDAALIGVDGDAQTHSSVLSVGADADAKDGIIPIAADSDVFRIALRRDPPSCSIALSSARHAKSTGTRAVPSHNAVVSTARSPPLSPDAALDVTAVGLI